MCGPRVEAAAVEVGGQVGASGSAFSWLLTASFSWTLEPSLGEPVTVPEQESGPQAPWQHSSLWLWGEHPRGWEGQLPLPPRPPPGCAVTSALLVLPPLPQALDCPPGPLQDL